MKKAFKLMCICLMFLVLPTPIYAFDIEVTELVSSINVAKNRVATIQEQYEIYFVENTKEFSRILDTSLKIERPNDSSSIIKPSIMNINASSDFSVNNKDKTKIISVKTKGTKDTTKSLNLSYQYDLGKDESSKYDEFYYNIVSNFDNVVSDVSFEIIFPSKINKRDITFFLNGEIVSDDFILYDVEDNIITGYLNKILNENDVFSVRVKLPDKYFVGAKDKFNYFKYLYLFLPLVSLGLVIYCWFKYAKGNRRKKELNSLPPRNFDPSEIAYLYKGKMEEADITVDLIYLANNGYLKVEENDDGYKLGKENTFNFIKAKDYKGKNAIQKLIFDGIFRDRKKSTLNDIEFTVKNKLMDAKAIIDNSDNKEKLFNKDINLYKKIVILLITLSIFFLTITPVKEFTGSYLLVPVLTGTMLFGILAFAVIDTGIIPKIILSVLFIGGSIGLNVYSLIGQDKLIFIYILGTIIVLLTAVIYICLPQRTKYGNKCMGEIEGFISSLLNMNPNKLKEILADDPNYYYDMVPYAIALGLIDEWAKLGDKIITERPKWHLSNEKFTLKKEIKFFKNFVFVTTQVMIKGLYNQKESQQVEFKKDIKTLNAEKN